MTTTGTVDTKLVKRGHTHTKYNTQRLAELKKCLSDPIYFAKTYVKIQHATKGQISFDLYGFQEELIKMYHGKANSIALLPRQSGKCVVPETLIKIKNKKTNEIKEISIGQFYNIVTK